MWPLAAHVLAASASDIPAAPVVAFMALGVVVAVVGHIARDYRVVGVGLAVLFLATAAMVLAGFTAYNDNPSDPRPCAIKAAC